MLHTEEADLYWKTIFCKSLWCLAAETGQQTFDLQPVASMMDILGWLLEMMGLTYVRLDGSTLVADRLATVDL